MNFFIRLFFSENKTIKVQLGWNEHMQIIADSLSEYNLKYPIIMFWLVPWNFEVFVNAKDLIGQSISCHWGLDEFLSKEEGEMELVIDSKGAMYTLSHDHHLLNNKTDYSYPSIFKGIETIHNLKIRIIQGSNQYISSIKPEINNKLNTMNDIGSIKELFFFVNKELGL